MSMMLAIVLIPISKFVPKIWMVFGHGVNRPGDLDF